MRALRGLSRSLLSGLALLALAACQHEQDAPPPERPQAPLTIERVTRTLAEPDCAGDGCARIEADYLRFANDAALSAALERRLLAMGDGIGDGSEAPATSLEGYAQAFFDEAKEARADYPEAAPYDASLGATVVAAHDDLLVLELDAYLFTGGAHGMPLTQYLVVDQRRRAIVTLDDMLLPGRSEAFDAALARAHRRWLEARGEDQNFAAQWPLSRSDNVAPLDADVVVKYQVYDLGPYAIGQPELHIPYAELEGVFRPRYLR